MTTTTEQAPAEAATTQEAPQEEPTIPGQSYAAYCHVGPGAEACDEGEKGTCSNPLHFHAFCRLPNAMQIQDIRDRAQAAEARRARLLRDPESDASVILEGDLYELERVGDRDSLVEEILQKDWFRDYSDAMKLVEEREEYEHIEDDQQKFRALDVTPEEERDEDEWMNLSKHLAAYGEAVDAELKTLTAPKRSALDARPTGELITMLRNDRITAESKVIAMQVFSQWQWFLGTLKPVESGRPKERVFESFEDLKVEDPSIINVIALTFGSLEQQNSDPKA